MECDERTHLVEVLKIAASELAWVLNEEFRMVVERLPRLSEFEHVVKSALEHRQTAMIKYRQHVEQHGCVAKALAAN